MTRGPVLNDRGDAPADAPADPVTLSRALLHAARELAQDPAALARTAALAAALRDTDPAAIAGDDARVAFWLNAYNALARHALHARGARGNLALQLGLFARAAYLLSGERYSLDVIEHGLLRGNRRPPPALFRTLGRGDPRLRAAPSRVDPRVHFALNCGARSCPPIRSYEADRLDAQLDLAARAYFAAEARVDREAGVATLPKLCKYYRADFGGERDAVRFAARHLPDDGDGAWLLANADRVRVRYGGYDWTIVS